jgi:hypothetical protein
MLLPCDYLTSESAKPKPRQRRIPVQDTSVGENVVDSFDDKDEFPSMSRGLRVELQNLSDAKQPIVKEPETQQHQSSRVEDNVVEEQLVDGEDQLSDSEDSTVQEQLVDGEDQPDEAEPDNVPNNDPVVGTEETVDANVANRPQRNRQPPQRLVYYAPGHAACYHCGAMISQFQQPIPQPYQFQQPIPQPYQFQQPIPQPYQFQQPIPQPYSFQQPVPQLYQVPMPTQHPWSYNYHMFPTQL